MKKNIILIFFALLFVGSVVAAGYFYWKWSMLKNNPTAVAEDESKALVEVVGKLILLPDEQPTIATVTDPSKLSDQAFFTNAQTGYKVLVFSVAKKAILYDPVGNKIIEVGPVNITEEGSNAVSGTVTTPKQENKNN